MSIHSICKSAQKKTLFEEILTWTLIGAKDVLESCEGWFIVSQSSITNCIVRASSNILSISACTSAVKQVRQHVFNKATLTKLCLPTDEVREPVSLLCSRSTFLLGLFSIERLAREMSALTRVMMMRDSKRCFK